MKHCNIFSYQSYLVDHQTIDIWDKPYQDNQGDLFY